MLIFVLLCFAFSKTGPMLIDNGLGPLLPSMFLLPDAIIIAVLGLTIKSTHLSWIEADE